jgi:hypothetical protein
MFAKQISAYERAGVTRFKCFIAVVCILMLFRIPAVQSEEQPAAAPEKRGNGQQRLWSQLLPEEIEQLTRDKILVTRRTYRQIFEPYLNPSTPAFITSDAIIHAFHVLFKESISRHEETNAEQLRVILKMVWDRIKPQPDGPEAKPADDKNPLEQKQAGGPNVDQDFQQVRRAAYTYARIVIAVAFKLLGDTPVGLDAKLGSLVDDEVEHVIGAKGTRMPEWITDPSPDFIGIDYSRYHPRGFYDRNELLRRYFRAVGWLQSIPFRVDRDKELLAIFLLGKTLAYYFSGDYAKRMEIENWFRCYNDLIGQRDDLDLLVASQIVRSRPADLNTVREYLAKMTSGDGRETKTNDPLGVVTETKTEPASSEFRIISPHRTPDAVLFDQTTSLTNFNRAWPSGLEICGILGSDYANQMLAAKVPSANQPALIEAMDASRKYFETKSLYNRYLNCLAALLDEPEPDAPSFLKSQAWKTKTCNTALSGWSQIRHAWTLQAKQTVHTVGGAIANLPSGFVEPEPEFFARLGELVELAQLLLSRCGASEPPRYRVAKDLRAFAELIEALKYPAGDQHQIELTRNEITIIERSIITLSALTLSYFSPEDIARRRQELIAEVRNLADDIEAGSYDGDPAFQAVILDNHYDIKPLWDVLGDTIRRLEVLAHKQLRGVAFSKRENYFITDFGSTLAFIMLYGGDSYRYPRDDVPRAVDIYANPEAGGYFHIGIARPREFLVLYPYRGEEVICRGAVMPYYEIISASRMTDAEWQKRLDSDERPENPDWLKSIFARGDPLIPDGK